MTLYEFHLLAENEQISRIYKDGVYIGKCIKDNKIVLLYQLEGFYIEIHYKKFRYFISHLKCFTSTEKINPFLEQIDVGELMKCVNLD